MIDREQCHLLAPRHRHESHELARSFVKLVPLGFARDGIDDRLFQLTVARVFFEQRTQPVAVILPEAKVRQKCCDIGVIKPIRSLLPATCTYRAGPPPGMALRIRVNWRESLASTVRRSR